MNDFLTLVRTPRRGRLKVFLGMAAGVGKTVAMLREARRLRDEGIDVVAGVVETHRREGTLKEVGDLELVPKRKVRHANVVLEELDTDAVIARAPAVALIDELAHTNIPGARNAKRWQDIQQLLEAGITVLSTLNIQHLESINDVVTQITGALPFAVSTQSCTARNRSWAVIVIASPVVPIGTSTSIPLSSCQLTNRRYASSSSAPFLNGVASAVIVPSNRFMASFSR